MKDLSSLVEKASHSRWGLWVLNFVFDRMVPFNGPHGFRIIEVDHQHVKTRLPHKRKNLNHVKGLHACALATLTELTSGFLLAARLDPKKFRLILRRLEMDYLYQGKMDATAEFVITEDWLNNTVMIPLQSTDVVDVIAEVKIHDVKGNQLTLGKAHWQIKLWSSVKTKA